MIWKETCITWDDTSARTWRRMLGWKRPVVCEKRPIWFEKRPVLCEKRRMLWWKRPVVWEKSLIPHNTCLFSHTHTHTHTHSLSLSFHILSKVQSHFIQVSFHRKYVSFHIICASLHMIIVFFFSPHLGSHVWAMWCKKRRILRDIHVIYVSNIRLYT